MQPFVEAYLDIETTGLSPRYSQITVVGIHLCNGDDTRFIQLVGREITANSILDALKGVSVIYTYNGRGFDIPFIYYCLGINLAELFEHHDLMLDCWRNNLYGGFKAVERQLGIERRLTEVHGYEAVRLWWRYVESFDLDALNTLLEYNKEDVVNLKTLKERLLKSSGKAREKEEVNMRKILIIEDGKPTLLDETEFTEEGKLQDYLEEYPALVPLSEIVEDASDLLCIGREVGAGSGSIDLLFIDKDGLLTIAETKLRKNREARREVVGQIIEYASYVTQWTVDNVYRIANQYFSKSDKVPLKLKGSTLERVMEEVVGTEFSDDDFRSEIAQNLKDGRIRLIIAVDKLIEPLRATVTFLNSRSTFDILLLQISDFEESESKKALVPLLFGYAIKTREGGQRGELWDKARFLDNTKDRCEPKIADVITKLYEFAESNADNISWGRGARFGSFTFRKSRYGIPTSVFTLQSDGYMYVSFGDMKGKGVKEEVLESFRARLSDIQGISIPEEAVSIGKFPSLMADTLIGEKNLKGFQDAVLDLCQKIES